MTEIENTEPAEVCLETSQPIENPPWYALDLGALKRSRLVWALFIGLVLASFSIVPLWRLLWYFPVYNFRNFAKVKDSSGAKREAWRWIEGREIRIYLADGVRPESVETVAAGARELIEDAGLDFAVTVMPMPEAVQQAYQASLLTKEVNGQPTQCVSFRQLESRLVELRDSDQHADMFVVNEPVAEVWWAHGMGSFGSGLVVFEEGFVSKHLGKHETGHLMGYVMHDSFPLFVFGYPWEGWPGRRDTLMMLYGDNNELSPRARDALHYFWRGIEQRTGRRYLIYEQS